MLARLAQKVLSKPEVPDAEPIKFVLYNLVLSQGTINFTDAAVKACVTLRPGLVGDAAMEKTLQDFVH